jgi:hypothetical protein
MARNRSKTKSTRTRKQIEKRAQKRRNKAGSSENGSSPQSSSNDRRRGRIAAQVPCVWQNETLEDAAIFDEAACERLGPELQQQVVSVRNALQLACEMRGKEATDLVSRIPRSSPLSQWRLMIRGLVNWLNDDLPSAVAVWDRLDPDRRPARMATALAAAHRTDLESIRIGANSGVVSVQTDPAVDQNTEALSGQASDEVGVANRLDRRLLHAAKLVRRIRIDRSAIRIAGTATAEPDEQPDALIGSRKVQWLKDFSRNYQATEPALVRDLQLAALNRAYAQEYVDVFEKAIAAFKGPAHDWQNLLLSYFYYNNMDSHERRAGSRLERYIDKDLPNNKRISEPLRQALISEFALRDANTLIDSPKSPMSMFGFFLDERDSTRDIEKLFRKAITAFPLNHNAQKSQVDWIESQLADDRLAKKKREQFEKKLISAMKAWAQSIPDDVEPKLWLVDHLMENEELEEAQPFVDWLKSARVDDPRVRATPWKWEFLNASRSCRRKAWFAEVPARLDAVEREWPGWLRPEWMAYLRAAWMLRSNNREGYEQARITICADQGRQRDSITDSCMILGAAQYLRVPAADLKSLRSPIDAALKDLTTLTNEDLCSVGSFFWDLQRVGLLYPAYRNHGPKLGRELFRRMKQKSSLTKKLMKDSRFSEWLLWSSEYRFWGDGYKFRLPADLSRNKSNNALISAAIINGTLKLRWNTSELAQLADQSDVLRKAAETERDPYYRYWFNSLADQRDKLAAEKDSSIFSQFASLFNSFYGGDDNEETPCDCPNCRAARARADSKKTKSNAKAKTKARSKSKTEAKAGATDTWDEFVDRQGTLF